MDASPLAGWENFYVITGSSAGGLTGLTFVVIALVRDAQGVRPAGVRMFVTPTIVHFSAVLGLAAFLSMPWRGVLGLSVGFGVAGVEYAPVWEDWTWHAILPGIAYALLLIAADLIWHERMQGLYAAAAASLILLFSGIHNAWDIAVWMTLKKAK
jgi:hypothetical protein